MRSLKLLWQQKGSAVLCPATCTHAAVALLHASLLALALHIDPGCPLPNSSQAQRTGRELGEAQRELTVARRCSAQLGLLGQSSTCLLLIQPGTGMGEAGRHLPQAGTLLMYEGHAC